MKKETALSYLRKAIDRFKSERRKLLHINRKQLDRSSPTTLILKAMPCIKLDLSGTDLLVKRTTNG